MKHMLVAAVAAGFAALVLVGCGSQSSGAPLDATDCAPLETTGDTPLEIAGGSVAEDGVSVTIQNATFAPKELGWDYSFDVTIENASDVEVMQVVYGIATYDADGSEIRSFGYVHDDEVRALPPGETVTDHIESGWGKAEPASVSLTPGVTIVPASEMPAIHLPQKGEYLYLALGDEKLANITSEPPVSLSFHIDQGGAGRTATFDAGEDLNRAVELLCDIRIGDGDAEFSTDNYNWVYLTWADGSHTSINLNLRNLEFSGHKNKPHSYTLEGLDPFWDFAASAATPDGDGGTQDS